MSRVAGFLRGIRVVDLSMGWAGPLAARNLADMGAEVIKVEGVRRFDWWRSWEATPEWVAMRGYEMSAAFNMVNRNKLDIALDLERDAGRQLLLRLVAISDVVVENYSATVLPRLGLDYPVLSGVRPDLVMISMPAFGCTGPWRDYRAYGSTVEQSAGLPHLSGGADAPPTMVHVAYGDATGGVNGAAALLTALRHRARTGEGQHIDLSQVQCMFPLGAHGLIHASLGGTSPERPGNRSEQGVPWGVFPARGADAWLVVQVSEARHWRALSGIVGGAPPRWDDPETRRAEVDEVERWLAVWSARQAAHQAAETLQAAGVPAAPVLDAGASLTDMHVAHREFWQLREREVVGVQPNPSPPFREAGSGPVPIRSPAPLLGQHNREVLAELLALDDEDIERLQREQVIGDHPLLG